MQRGDHSGPGAVSLHAVPIAGLFGTLLLANALAWLWACTAFAGRPALLGTALLAWMFGLRHAVDADHIAAIDNVVRKLLHEGRRPMLTGTWFSLGHSTVVVLASAAVALGAAGMQDRLPALRLFGGTAGTLISAAFLLLIALFNCAVLRAAWRRFRAAGRGGAPDAIAPAAPPGLLTRLFRPLFRAVSRSWHMFPLGFLFGLGFDTATEIGLLGLSAAEAAHGMAPWQTLVFPALFTAGMALIDSADSVMMLGAYRWALREPLRKLGYDVALTAVSVVVALLIGGVEVIGLLSDKLHLHASLLSGLAAANPGSTRLGVGIVAMFVLACAAAAAMHRRRTRQVAVRRIDAKRG